MPGFETLYLADFYTLGRRFNVSISTGRVAASACEGGVGRQPPLLALTPMARYMRWRSVSPMRSARGGRFHRLGRDRDPRGYPRPRLRAYDGSLQPVLDLSDEDGRTTRAQGPRSRSPRITSAEARTVSGGRPEVPAALIAGTARSRRCSDSASASRRHARRVSAAEGRGRERSAGGEGDETLGVRMPLDSASGSSATRGTGRMMRQRWFFRGEPPEHSQREGIG